MIPALVLTAGIATRLRPLSFDRAKAAMPVAGEPLVRRILRGLAAAGVTDAVLNLHHLPHTITRVVGDGSDLGLRVRYSWEMPLLGSAGGPRRALPLLGSSTFLVVNGDTLTDVHVGALVAEHRRTGALITMAAVRNTMADKYGGLAVSADGALVGFTRRGSPERSLHFVGVQVAEAEAFASVPDGTPYESVGALYPALIQAQPGSIRTHLSAARFFDVGTPADYLLTSVDLAQRETGATLHGERVRIHPTADVRESILWDDVEVGAGARLRRCIVTDGVRLPSGTRWEDVTIRIGTGELAAGERRIDGLAVGPLR